MPRIKNRCDVAIARKGEEIMAIKGGDRNEKTDDGRVNDLRIIQATPNDKTRVDAIEEIKKEAYDLILLQPDEKREGWIKEVTKIQEENGGCYVIIGAGHGNYTKTMGEIQIRDSDGKFYNINRNSSSAKKTNMQAITNSVSIAQELRDTDSKDNKQSQDIGIITAKLNSTKSIDAISTSLMTAMLKGTAKHTHNIQDMGWLKLGT